MVGLFVRKTEAKKKTKKSTDKCQPCIQRRVPCIRRKLRTFFFVPASRAIGNDSVATVSEPLEGNLTRAWDTPRALQSRTKLANLDSLRPRGAVIQR